jgi:phage gp36-like protein
MSYCTPQDLIERLGLREATAISDRDKTGQPNTAELTRLLAEAEDVANGYIRRRYALPLLDSNGQAASAPPALKLRVIDIARYCACGTEIMVTEEIRNRYKDAIAWLRDVMDGKAALGDFALAGSGGAAPLGGAWAVVTQPKAFGDLGGML